MKNLIKIALMIGLFTSFSFYQKTIEDEFILSGKTNDLANGTQISLFDLNTNEVYCSTEIHNNEFVLQGKLKDSPFLMGLKTKDGSQMKFIWMENKSLHFDASSSDLSMGSLVHSEIQELSDKYMRETQMIRDPEQMKEAGIQFIKDHPNSVLSALNLSIFTTSWGKKTTEELYSQFSEEVKVSVYGRQIQKYLEVNKNPQIGDQYIDIELPNLHNSPTRLSDNLGEVTLLEFWASNCYPCRKGNPKLLESYNKYREKGFKIVAVSSDTNPESWKKAIEKDGLPWTHLCDFKGRTTEAQYVYGINAIPDNFLMDKNGVIVGQNLKGDELDEKLESLLAGE